MEVPDEYLAHDGSIRRQLAEEARLLENHYRWERALRRKKLAARAIRALIATLGLAILATLILQPWLLA